MNIENKKQFATILLAVGLGLVAAFLTSQYVQSSIKEQTAALAKEYQKKSAALVNELEFMKKEFGKMAAKQADLEKQQREQEQKVILAATAAAKQQQGKETDRGEVVQMTSFSVKTPPGKRALTIMIDSLSAVGGLINPGDYIDVLAHLDVPKQDGGGSEKVTTVLFQNIQVLSIGTNFNPVGSTPQYDNQQRSSALYVTLALSPQEVGLLTFAQSHGKLQLTLRAPTEKDKKTLDVASWQGLADFVKQNQGTDLQVPTPKGSDEDKDVAEPKEDDMPTIQIFKSGREL